MKVRVKLKVPYPNRRGGTCKAGETIKVNLKMRRHLIATGKAVAIDEVPRMTTAVINVRDLRGDAKKAWLRGQIRSKGSDPTSDTIVGLTKQLRAL